ncbi:MAG TPA: sugar transferase [Bacteroidota bacterium]|nr:sugar transferase [Bacteroidota bacterium]
MESRNLKSVAQRGFDLAFTVPGLIILSPLLLLLSLAVKATDGGPILYRGQRMGRGGRVFSLLKFRTMVVDADKLGAGVTVAADPRITPIGRIFRKYKLDELPQLFNVVTGDMSLVGPRPEDHRVIARYSPKELEVLQFRPGITSPASLHFRDEQSLLTGPDWETQYFTAILPKKIDMELKYFPHRTIPSDFVIIMRTLMRVLTPRR